MPNICNFIPIRLSERAINERLKFIQAQVCYAISAAQSGDVVYTANSGTITFSGDGTQGNPLTATFTGTVPVAANPTGTIGLTAVNGAASTYMRSDAAPALSQAIVPTWTGLHTFSAAALFTPAAAPAYAEGKLYYDNSFSALSYMDDISGTSIQIGYEGLVRARNNTGSTITNGQVVYISGSVGQNPSIALAQANSLATSGVIGIATHDIPNNTVGKVTVFGLVNDLNTSGFTEGDVLYLSATTPGAFTNVAPSSPNILVSLGSVQTTHVTQGKILATISRGQATDVALGTSDSIVPTQNAVKAYVDNKFGVTTVQNDATGPVAITAVQSGTIFTNTGAAVNVQFNLPAATVGLHYEFVNTVGATTSAMIVRANGTDTIRNTTESAAGGAVQSGSAASGDSIKVICHTAGKWMVMYDGAGDWSVIA